jgi:excisionase family DNA binding protein
VVIKLELDRYTLDSDGIAKKLGYHVQYVRFLAAANKIPALKRGRKWLFDESEVLAFFAKQTNDAHKENNHGRRKEDRSTEGSDILR